MINEKKVKLMTKLALYEQNEGRKELPLSKYFKGDYVSLNMLNTAIIATICYICIVVVGILFRIDDFIDNLSKIDFVSFGKELFIAYAIFLIINLIIAYSVYTRRYKRIKKNLNEYNENLKLLYRMYKQEKKNKNELRTEIRQDVNAILNSVDTDTTNIELGGTNPDDDSFSI